MADLLMIAGKGLAAFFNLIGVILYRPGDDDERESILSIRKQDARIFYPTMFLLWIAAAAILAYVEYAPEPNPRVFEYIAPRATEDGHVLRLLQRLGTVMIPLAGAAMILTSALTNVGRLTMAIANFINRKLVEPQVNKHREEGRVQGIAEGHTQGFTEGRTQTNQRWSEWNRRRQEAQAQGRTFNEPPPDETE